MRIVKRWQVAAVGSRCAHTVAMIHGDVYAVRVVQVNDIIYAHQILCVKFIFVIYAWLNLCHSHLASQ